MKDNNNVFTNIMEDEMNHPVVTSLIDGKVNVARQGQGVVELKRSPKENRSRRLYIAVPVSMFNNLIVDAEKEETSVNNVVNQILKGHYQKVKKF